MKFGDLLTDGMVRGVQDGAAEDDGAGGVEIRGWDCGDTEGHFFAAADDDGVEVFVVVHDVELGDAGDEFIVQGEDDVALVEGLIIVASWGRAVDFADHEELMPGWVGFSDFGDPGFRDSHDAAL